MYELLQMHECGKKNYWMSSHLEKAHKQINLLIECLGKYKIPSGC